MAHKKKKKNNQKLEEEDRITYKKLQFVAVTALILGVLIGFYLFSWVVGSPVPSEKTRIEMEEGHSHDHSDGEYVIGEHDHGSHSHDTLEVDFSSGIPTVDISVFEDPKEGVNVQIIVENFEFDPIGASTLPVPGKGHAHIYLDGKKVGRVYGEWYHISEIEPGLHEIEVTLNSNDHKDLTYNGEIISDIEIIEIE